MASEPCPPDCEMVDAAILSRLQSLLGRADNAKPAQLGEFEDALTTGYAHALYLERDCLRLRRRLEELVAQEHHPQAEELGMLARRLRDADGCLRRFRSLLGELKVRADSLRAAPLT
jgi:hypothetical protein